MPLLSPSYARFTVRRWLRVRPATRQDAESTHPVNIQAALRAVEAEVLEFAFEVSLHVQEFEPQHLGVGDKRMPRESAYPPPR